MKERAIISAFKKAAENQKDNLVKHFVFAAYDIGRELKSLLLEAMKKYKFKHAIVTFIDMIKNNLMEKPEADVYLKGNMDNLYKGSINDELETFLQDIMGMDTNKLTSLRPLYMGIIENVAPKRST